MSLSMFWNLMYIVTAVVMLFQFRALLQSSSANYYHPMVQAVTKLTNPLVNIPVWRQARMGSFFIAGFIVAMIISLAWWLLSALLFVKLPIVYALIASVILFIKSFGYLVICLLLVQALCSWLPATREFGYTLSQATEPITSPVQRIIPPIGMIDISLMVVLLLIYGANALIYKILASVSPELFLLWRMM